MQPEDYMSFLVRLWRDPPGENQPGGWRGEIEQVQSGARWCFSSHAELLAFLHQLARAPSTLAPPEEGSNDGDLPV